MKILNIVKRNNETYYYSTQNGRTKPISFVEAVSGIFDHTNIVEVTPNV